MQSTPSFVTSETPAPARHRQELPTSLSLLARLSHQDQTAWRDFVTLYAPLVVRWCHRQGVQENDIADVAQEVFLKVSRGIQSFHKEAAGDSFRGWLCRITHREIINFRRRTPAVRAQGGTEAHQQLEQLAVVKGHEEEGGGSTDATQHVSTGDVAEPSADDARQESSYLYKRAVQIVRGEFTDTAWQIFQRVTIDGNSATAIAEEFGTTSAAVRQTKSRILRRLRQIVGDAPD